MSREPATGNNTNTLTVVIGPRTALARTWLSGTHKNEVVLIARDAAEQSRLAKMYPERRIWTPGALDQAVLATCNTLRIMGFAIGLIHPEVPDWERTQSAAERDLGLVEALLKGSEKASAHLLFVSSILAHAPRGTAWYGGWKNVLEAKLSQLATQHPHCAFSTVFPGRLCESRGQALPLSMLSTPLQNLAARCSTIIRGDNSTRQIIGVDARLWLALRGAVSIPRAVLGRI